MRHGLLLGFAMGLLACSSAFADDVACVQRELARLGLDPGPVDGQLGSKTLKAAKTFQQGALYMQDLDVVTSPRWCRTLEQMSSDALAPVDQTTALDPQSATLGIVSGDALAGTPVLGITPEYQVPKWVNNPH